jgi:hypothetical protein
MFALAIVLKNFSRRFARQLSDKREKVHKLLQDAQSRAPHHVWDGMQEALTTYKFDEVEVSNMHEIVSALAVRYDGDSGIRRRAGSVIGLRTPVAAEERADSPATAHELLESGELREDSPNQDTPRSHDRSPGHGDRADCAKNPSPMAPEFSAGMPKTLNSATPTASTKASESCNPFSQQVAEPGSDGIEGNQGIQISGRDILFQI